MSPETDVGYEGINLALSAETVELLESRGILQTEVKNVIHAAEVSGVKLYDPDGDSYLAKKRIADITYFVVYRPASDDAFEILTAYCCKTSIVEE